MPDPYQFTEQATAARTTPDPTRSAGLLRPLVWTLLVISAVGNTVVSSTHLPVGIQLTLGVVTLACIAVLVAQRVRRVR